MFRVSLLGNAFYDQIISGLLNHQIAKPSKGLGKIESEM